MPTTSGTASGQEVSKKFLQHQKVGIFLCSPQATLARFLKHGAEEPADEFKLLPSCQTTAIKRLINFHMNALQEQLKGLPVANDVMQLLGDSKVVVDGGASIEVLEWHLNHIQELAGNLPGNDIGSALSILSMCISHAKSLGL